VSDVTPPRGAPSRDVPAWSHLEPAGLLRRGAAKLVDLALIAGLVVVVTYGAFLVVFPVAVAVVAPMPLGYLDLYLPIIVPGSVWTAFWFVYASLCEHVWATTLGKRLLGIEVRSAGNEDPSLAEAMLRNLYLAVGAIGFLPFGVLLSFPLQLVAVASIPVSVLRDRPTGRGWHDRLAGGTIVARAA
jgi:uncharacterized RDD family membrane protein YckC